MTASPRSWLYAVRLRAGLLAATALLIGLLGLSALRPIDGADPVRRPTATAWRVLGVAPLPWDFGDLRSVTHRWSCARDGRNSYADKQCDPWGRLFNYPRVWLAPAWLGWGPEMTRPIAFFEIALAFCALWTLFPARTWKGSVFVVALLLSPPVMFAVERGNVDLLIFALLVLGLRLTRDLPAAWRDGGRKALFAGLAFLKLFPIAAFVMLARSPRGTVWAAAGGGLTALALALIYRGDLGVLQANTVHEFYANYGRLALFATDSAADAWRAPRAVMSLIFVAMIAGLSAALGFVRHGDVTARLGNLFEGRYETDLAAAALSIFGLTFIIGLNYDYRLIFLLPVFPLLLARDGGRWVTAPRAIAALLLCRFLLAHRLPDGWLGAVDWVLFGGTAAWFAASAAPGLMDSPLVQALRRPGTSGWEATANGLPERRSLEAE